MTLYNARVEAQVTATLKVIANTKPEAEEKAELIVRNDIIHDLEITAVSVVEEA
jgi:hypothetical protein